MSVDRRSIAAIGSQENRLKTLLSPSTALFLISVVPGVVHYWQFEDERKPINFDSSKARL